MKKFFVFFLVILLINSNSIAAIRRVGFFATPVTGVDYATFAAAYTASVAGDTILVFPGTPAINQTFSKRLTVIGPGDWLDANSTPKGNANMQAFPGTVPVTSLSFQAGSDGSTIMGLQGGVYYVNASNITIRRNRELLVYIAVNSPANSTNNIQVIENYRVSFVHYYSNGSSVTNLNFSNNLVSSLNITTGNTYSGIISNNVWAYDATLTAAGNGGSTAQSVASVIELGGGAFVFQNNILASYTSASAGSNNNYFYFSNGTNTIFNYNLYLQANSGTPQSWGPGTGNVITPVANAASIFAAWPAIGSSSADARYMLGASSPALTIGAGGTPIGMFAGTTPYKLSMIPPIPSIYQLGSPQGNNPTGSTMQINVSTRGNN